MKPTAAPTLDTSLHIRTEAYPGWREDTEITDMSFVCEGHRYTVWTGLSIYHLQIARAAEKQDYFKSKVGHHLS